MISAAIPVFEIDGWMSPRTQQVLGKTLKSPHEAVHGDITALTVEACLFDNVRIQHVTQFYRKDFTTYRLQDIVDADEEHRANLALCSVAAMTRDEVRNIICYADEMIDQTRSQVTYFAVFPRVVLGMSMQQLNPPFSQSFNPGLALHQEWLSAQIVALVPRTTTSHDRLELQLALQGLADFSESVMTEIEIPGQGLLKLTDPVLR